MYQDGQYLEKNPTWHGQDSPYKARWIAEILGRGGVVPRTVVEVGCGAGGILRELAERLPDAMLEGYDISPQALEIARANPHARVTVHEAPVLEESRRWDLLLAIDVLEHMENPAQWLRDNRPHADRAVVHLPLDLSVQTILRGTPILDRRRDLGHIHMFVRGTARALLEENGWEILEERYTSGALELPLEPGAGHWLKNRLLRLPRRVFFAIAPHLAVRFLGGWSILLLCAPKEDASQPRSPAA